MKTEDLLKERKTTHGDYTANATITMQTLEVWQTTPNWRHLTYDQKLTLTMLANKIGRALCGDPNEPDHWDDCAGYSKLTADRCRSRQKGIKLGEELAAKGNPTHVISSKKT